MRGVINILFGGRTGGHSVGCIWVKALAMIDASKSRHFIRYLTSHKEVATWPITMRVFPVRELLPRSLIKAPGCDFVLRRAADGLPMFVLQTSFQSFRRHCPSIPF
jgi:hypothetical protein